MNERIRELYEQARLQAKSIDADLDRQGWMDLYHQKFAELIVRECANRMGEEIVYNNAYKERNKAISDMIEVVKQHFGVEDE